MQPNTKIWLFKFALLMQARGILNSGKLFPSFWFNVQKLYHKSFGLDSQKGNVWPVVQRQSRNQWDIKNIRLAINNFKIRNHYRNSVKTQLPLKGCKCLCSQLFRTQLHFRAENFLCNESAFESYWLANLDHESLPYTGRQDNTAKSLVN